MGLFNEPHVDAQAFLAASQLDLNQQYDEERIAVLSFRTGNTAVKDWGVNARIYQEGVGESKALSFFQMAIDGISPAILEKWNPLAEAGFTLYLTGHNLGGALALIATRQIGSESVGACYTFGPPKAGRIGFMDGVETPVYRVVNANDLVPRSRMTYLQSIFLFVLRARQRVT